MIRRLAQPQNAGHSVGRLQPRLGAAIGLAEVGFQDQTGEPLWLGKGLLRELAAIRRHRPLRHLVRALGEDQQRLIFHGFPPPLNHHPQISEDFNRARRS